MPVDGRLVKAKRFPVHAAVTVCDMTEVKRLLTEDAEFHVGRKIPDLEVSVLHSACSSRPTHGSPLQIFYDIAKYLVEMGAPINDRDAMGQTALHYAVCHSNALQLVTIITESGAQVDPERQRDGWTPLHLASMFGKTDVAIKLLEMGADPTMKGTSGDTAEDVAKRYKNHRLADVLHSPRQAHTPSSYPSQYGDMMRKYDEPPPAAFKIKDEHVDWRDEDGNTLLHYAAWIGNIYLARNIFDSPKARKLVAVSNNKGATPLAMAIIASQDRMVEEFFMNKNAKKTIDFTSALNETKETIPHLLLQYAPYVHPKFLLKRKDITKEILNAVDVDGNTPLLHVAARNNIHTISHILSSKAVKDNKMLNLGVKNKAGKTVLHYLVDHKDEENFRAFLDREELTSKVANLPDNDGRTPMVYCLTKGSPYMARDILEHPTAKNKFRLDLCHTADGRSPLHLVAEQGNALLWQLAVERPDCDLTARDAQGNTPLMRAAISGRDKILGVWLKDKENATKVDQSVVNKENKTLVRLFVEHLPPRMLKLLLSTIDAKGCIDNVDTEGNTTLLAATKLGKWKAAKEILFNFGLKVGDNEEDAEGVVDVHPADKTGISALTLMMVATVKLARQEQTFSMKKQRVLANEAKQEQADIWDVVKLMLIREKEQHGTSMTQGRDGGSECIKKQLSHAKIIKPQIVDEVVQEFAKQYQFIKRKKPPTNAPAPVNPTTSTSAVPAPTPTPTTASVMVSAMTKSVSVVATSAPVPTPKSAPTSASVVATSASAPVPAPKSAPASVVATSASSGSVPAPKSAPTPASVVATSASAPIPAPKSAPASVVAISVSSASVPAPKSAPASVIATYASAPVPAPKSAPTPAPSTAPKENVPEAPTPATGSITPPSITLGGVTTTPKAPPNTANAPSQFIKNLSQASTISSSTAVTRSTTIAKTASITTAAPSSSKADENPKQAINGSHQAKENGIAKEKFVGVDQQPKPPPRDELIKTSKENAAESKLANESVKPSAPAAVEKPKNDLPKTLLIPGRKEIESTPSSPNTETADEFSAMPSVPARRSKKKFAEASTQTESVKGCECCCTCGRGKNNA